MKSAVVLLAGLFAFTAYYVYLPLPSTVSEPWRLMLLDASFRAAQQTTRRYFFPSPDPGTEAVEPRPDLSFCRAGGLGREAAAQ
ncbi:UNVERIFIED_CONTAM: hypothetical protein K2H54_059699 [Gekko kuhli]